MIGPNRLEKCRLSDAIYCVKYAAGIGA